MFHINELKLFHLTYSAVDKHMNTKELVSATNSWYHFKSGINAKLDDAIPGI